MAACVDSKRSPQSPPRPRGLLDDLSWSAARGAVEAVRYQPSHIDLVLACGASQPEVPAGVARWVAETRGLPAVVTARHLPHRFVRALAAGAARWFGPTGSAVVRWLSGAIAAAADRAGARTLERPLRARAHPGLLVPHPHSVVVVAIDMRGFTLLTRTLDDTQYLTDLIGEYLTEMTTIVEQHRGLVFQYTGDGLLALFLPELAGVTAGELLDRLAGVMGPEIHATFDRLHERWRAEWQATGRATAEIGLGVGTSFGRCTIGYIGPGGKKQFGVIGEPVNLAAYLCSEAEAGTVLIDRESFARAGTTPPANGKILRLSSKKPHQRLDTVCLRYGRGAPEAATWHFFGA